MSRYFGTEPKRRTGNPKFCIWPMSSRGASKSGSGDVPSVPSAFVFTDRILHVLIFPSWPTDASMRSSWLRTAGLNATLNRRFGPCGRSIRVFNIQKPDLRSHCQIFKYTSGRGASSPSRVSTVAIHSPDSESTARSTRAGCNSLSSRLETRFDGETSSSERSFDDEGENVCREEG